MRRDSKFEARRPVVEALLPLGLTYAEVAEAIGCCKVTIRNDVVTLGGLSMVAPGRPTKEEDVYVTCFNFYSRSLNQEPDNEFWRNMIRPAIERKLDIAQLNAFSGAFLSGAECMWMFPIPPELCAEESLLVDLFGLDRFSDRDQLNESRHAGQELYVLFEHVRVGERKTPRSLEDAKLAFIQITRTRFDRQNLVGPMPDGLAGAVREALETLTEREQYVIRHRYGIDLAYMTLEKLAVDMGVTRQRVRHIELRAFRKLRRSSTSLRLFRFVTNFGDMAEWLKQTERELEDAQDEIAKARDTISTLTELVRARLGPETLDTVLRGCELPNKVFFMRFDEMEMSVRSSNCLKNSRIEYVWQLVAMTEAELLTIKNFGRKSLREIKEILAQLGANHGVWLHLGMDLPERVAASIKVIS